MSAVSQGAGLLTLQGVSEFELPRVLRYDDDWYRLGAYGNVTYRAASRPLSLADVLASGELRPGKPGDGGVYLEVERSDLIRQAERLLDDMPIGGLGERLIWLRHFMAANYEYSTVVENPDLHDPLENFLFFEKRGYWRFLCDGRRAAGADDGCPEPDRLRLLARRVRRRTGCSLSMPMRRTRGRRFFSRTTAGWFSI